MLKRPWVTLYQPINTQHNVNAWIKSATGVEATFCVLAYVHNNLSFSTIIFTHFLSFFLIYFCNGYHFYFFWDAPSNLFQKKIRWCPIKKTVPANTFSHEGRYSNQHQHKWSRGQRADAAHRISCRSFSLSHHRSSSYHWDHNKEPGRAAWLWRCRGP